MVEGFFIFKANDEPLFSRNRPKETCFQKEAEAEILFLEYRKLDFVSYVLEGKTFVAALSLSGLEFKKESAFLSKKELNFVFY